MPIGKQDRYAAAFGGLNEITFQSSGCTVTPLNVSWETRQRLQDNLLLFFTGHSRNSADILPASKLRPAASPVHPPWRRYTMVVDVKDCFMRGDLSAFMLHENWMQKKRFAPGITNELIDESYATAQALGAVGGKITGTGGGGFLMIYCKYDQPAVTDALERRGLLRMDFNLDSTGAHVLMNAGLSLQSSTLRPRRAGRSVPSSHTTGQPDSRQAFPVTSAVSGEVAT